MTFKEFELHESLLRVLPEIGFENPTPIQEQAMGPVMQGHDVLGSAQTGTGKTAAFMLPILHLLLSESSPKKGMRVLVLEPTRELALQVEEQAKLFSAHTKLRSVCVYGGVSMLPQEKAFQEGVEIIAATPGRLLDHMRQGNVDASNLKILVLDEVDRMLDMGFLPDVRAILSRLPKERQTLFFSATVPFEIQHLCDSMLKDPVRIAITPERKTAEGITQKVYPVVDHLKPLLLHRLLTDERVNSALVFTKTKQGADKVCSVVERHGFSVERIHGDRSQKERLEALTAFKEGRAKFLVATDIAARGLDVEGISHVINYDLPDSPDDYVHRIGRTARAGATGHAYSLMAPRERGLLSSIEQHIQMKLEICMLDDFKYQEELGPQHEVRQGHDGIRHFDDKPRSAAPRPDRDRGGQGGGGRSGSSGRPPRQSDRGASAPASLAAGGVLRDADERASVTLRRKGAPAPVEGAAAAPFAPSSEVSGEERGPRRRSRGGRGRDRERTGGFPEGTPSQPDRAPSGAGRSMAPRAPQAPAMSATEVLRRAGSQKAAVESSAMELRPVSKPAPSEAAAAPSAPSAPSAPAETRSKNYNVVSEAGDLERPAPRPQQPRQESSAPRMDRPQGQGEPGRAMEGGNGPRRRRRRGGRGGRDRGPVGSEGQAQGGERQGGRPQFQGQQRQGGFNNPNQPRSQAPQGSASAPVKKPGLWSKLKGALGLGGSSAPKNNRNFDDKW